MARPQGIDADELPYNYSLFTNLEFYFHFQDHMRRAGDVCFSDVYREGGG
jgi:hypothetical protein